MLSPSGSHLNPFQTHGTGAIEGQLTGQRVDSSTEMAKTFKVFFLIVTEQEELAEEPEIESFLTTSGMPSLQHEEAAIMEGEITREEFDKGVGCSKSGRVPGPDGFALMREQLSPWFLRAFNSLRSLPPSRPVLNRATITLIHKEGKDLGLCDSYRRIPLLNTDLKLFSKIKV